MTDPSNPILVVGATGHHGATGAHVARGLLDKGKSVRILARSHTDRSQALADLGAEVTIGDLHDLRTLTPALDGVDLAYFTYPVKVGVVTAAANFAAAARQAGSTPRTVVMSMAPAHPSHLSQRGREQWVAEETLAWSGLNILALRVTATFHENIPVFHRQSIRTEGVIRNNFGDSKVGWISGADAGELGLAALLHPERFTAPISYPPGSEELSHTQVAALMCEELGRPIHFQSVAAAQWRDELIKLCHDHPDEILSPFGAEHISSVGTFFEARGGPVRPVESPPLTDLIGKPPVTLREYIRINRDIFS